METIQTSLNASIMAKVDRLSAPLKRANEIISGTIRPCDIFDLTLSDDCRTVEIRFNGDDFSFQIKARFLCGGGFYEMNTGYTQEQVRAFMCTQDVFDSMDKDTMLYTIRHAVKNHTERLVAIDLDGKVIRYQHLNK